MVFVFLRRTRPTLIVAAAIPISLVATFGLVWTFGYTLNTMTLLGMTLAVGVVIDDAIVVLENIERHREGGVSAEQAATDGTREIAFAATAATVSVAVVFLPVVFVEGLVGSFLGEFGLTVAGSVMISLFVALTLTPMLAARMPPPAERSHGGLYQRLEAAFRRLDEGYRRLLDWTLAHRGRTVGIALLSLTLALGFGSLLQSEFFPPTDNGIFFARMEALPGTSIEATREYVERDERYMLDQPELVGMFSSVGSAGSNSVPLSHTGMVFGMLSSASERERDIFEIIDAARKQLNRVPGRSVRIFSMSETMSTQAEDFVFELRGNLPLMELDRLAEAMLDELSALPGYVDLDKSLKLGMPELRVAPDRQKAASLGVDARTVATTIQAMVGGIDVGVFKDEGQRYDIRMRLDESHRAEPEAIQRLYVRNERGEVVELRNLVDVALGAAPSAITRTDRQRAVAISGNLIDKPLGTAIAEAREIAARILPENVGFELAGNAEAMQEGMEQFVVAMGLAILGIYMVLAAQFESLVHPLTVMLALPLAVVGALGGLLVTGHTLNLFSLIGILLLFGLVTKNSILLVDYANQLRRGRHGQGPGHAHRRTGAHAPGADDGAVDDLRRAARRVGHRPRRGEPRSDGGRHRGGDALLDGADPAGGARLLSALRRRGRGGDAGLPPGDGPYARPRGPRRAPASDLAIRPVAQTVSDDESAAAVRDPPAVRGSLELVGIDRAPRRAGLAIDKQQVPRRSRPIGRGHLDDGRSAEVQAAGGSAEHAAQALVSVERAAVHVVAGVRREERHPALDVIGVEREAVASEEIADGHTILGGREHEVSLPGAELRGLGGRAGGEGGIRTPGGIAPTPDFESGPFNRTPAPLRCR